MHINFRGVILVCILFKNILEQGWKEECGESKESRMEVERKAEKGEKGEKTYSRTRQSDVEFLRRINGA